MQQGFQQSFQPSGFSDPFAPKGGFVRRIIASLPVYPHTCTERSVRAQDWLVGGVVFVHDFLSWPKKYFRVVKEGIFIPPGMLARARRSTAAQWLLATQVWHVGNRASSK